MTVDVERCLAQGSIAELGAMLRARRLSAVEAVGWYLARIQSISQSGPTLNAVREVSVRAMDDAREADRELAAGRERGPLHGIPVLLKDNILTSDGMAQAQALQHLQASGRSGRRPWFVACARPVRSSSARPT